MPIILEQVNSANAANSATVKNYGPKDYSSILTGNGINQGLLRSNLLAGGSDNVPNHIITTICTDQYENKNHAYHVHDDVKSYTSLQQDISICRAYQLISTSGRNQTFCLPTSVIRDHFITFEDASGNTKTYRSRLFLNQLFVYKAVNNYALGNYTLVAVNELNGTECFGVNYNALTANQNITPAMPNPIKKLYEELAKKVIAANRGWTVKVDDSGSLGDADANTSMYDLIMRELEIIKTPGMLHDVLKALSATSFDALSEANNVMNLINIPFTLYQSDVIDVVNSRSAEEAKRLKNANTSLHIADVLNQMSGSATNQIPELVGKKYTTKQANLTTEQLAAIESSNMFTIVAAGAGTGKSTCIQHRLAFMEENGCDMTQTFVLSFTKAAAGHIKKIFKDCKSSTIADFTHNFVNVILDDGQHTRVDIVAHSDFIQKLQILMDDLVNANILQTSTIKALQDFVCNARLLSEKGTINVHQIGTQTKLLDMLDASLNPEAMNLISILKMLHCSSLELDPIIFHSQLSVIKPNIEHIVIDESQDSNRLEFLTMLKMCMLNDISIYVVGDCAQTLYEFRDADPRILNNLTKLFPTYDLSINHRSTQIILDVANLMSSTMSTHKTMLRANQMMTITKQAIDDTVSIDTYSEVDDPAVQTRLDLYVEKHLGQNETIAVIARSGNDVEALFTHLNKQFGQNFKVQNITSQRRNDITILSAIGANLNQILPKFLNDWNEFSNIITQENIRINSNSRGGSRYNSNGPTVNKVTIDWLQEMSANAADIILKLNDPNERDKEIRKLQMSLLDAQTDKNNMLQRVMDAKNAKLKEEKADIIVCTIHGVKGLEYDHVACFINTESGRSGYTSNSDENKRIAYVALTRAKKTECVFCTKEKLVKDFIAYRESMP